MHRSPEHLKVLHDLRAVHRAVSACGKCSAMCGTPVHGVAIDTKIMALGQAPGIHEAARGKPFAFTAGKTLFKWFKAALDLDEDEARSAIYLTAVARCFPGKSKSGKGDREPSPTEIANCREHVSAEVKALQPKLLLAIGKLAIAEALGPDRFRKGTTLNEVVGKVFEGDFHGCRMKIIPLPHPSGVSRWHQTEPGKTKLAKALLLVMKESAEFLIRNGKLGNPT